LLRIAAAQYPLSQLRSWDEYVDKVSRWVGEAAFAGARLLLFPEYGSMELITLPPAPQSFAEQVGQLQRLLPEVLALFTALARRHGVHILLPSILVRVPGDGIRNTAYLAAPDGSVAAQEKLVMTRFEREHGIQPGNQVRVLDTSLGRIGVAICYDCEFPLIARRQVEAGAQLILVPSCTDGMAGYHRVRIGAQARALENQCFVVQSPTVGLASWSDMVDVNVGAAAVFCPADRGLPDDGVVAMGSLDEAQWLYAELDFTALEAVRRDGQVLNHQHWPEHEALGAADILRLGS
jgi:predicted amidohydrolase